MENLAKQPILPPGAGPLNQTKRAAIMTAAAEVFADSGYASASIDAIAVRAGVSRQTVYNQIGDKDKVFRVVVLDIIERSSAGFFAVLETFPDHPADLKVDLTAFAARLLRKSVCEPHTRSLLRLLYLEGARHPELFAAWREYGPGRKYPAIAARLAQLAHAGHLEIEDSFLAARQFTALVVAEVRQDLELGIPIPEAEIDGMARNAIGTFLRAYGKR